MDDRNTISPTLLKELWGDAGPPPAEDDEDEDQEEGEKDDE